MKLALLCDYGLDDAIATLYLLNNAEKFEKIDILPIGGNVPLSMAVDNAKRILSFAQISDENIRVVDTTVIHQFEEYLPEIHGKDGIGDILPLEYTYNKPLMPYDLWLSDIDDSYVVLSLGPATLTVDILRKKNIKNLIIMGGNIAETPNYGEYEFNHGMDAEAFAECVKHDHFTATLDTPISKFCDFNKIKLNSDGLMEKFIKRAVELSNFRNEKECYIYDLVAAVYLLHPEKFIVEKATDNFGNTLKVLKYIASSPLI